jgi:hypothetical protein
MKYAYIGWYRSFRESNASSLPFSETVSFSYPMEVPLPLSWLEICRFPWVIGRLGETDSWLQTAYSRLLSRGYALSVASLSL